MNIGFWSEPVAVRLGRSGEFPDTVETTLAATQVLVHQWPAQGRILHATACDVCFAALEGKADPEEAREAFIEAAREADILADYIK